MKFRIILIFISVFLLHACHYADMGGMFVSTESVNQRFGESEMYNTTHPFLTLQAGASPYTISVASDLHVGKTVNLTKFVELKKNDGTLAVVFNGDMCNGNDYDYDNLYQALPDTADLKYFITTGNHELYFAGWKYFAEKFGTSTFYFTVDNMAEKDLFIVLDTGSGTLGSKQFQWFQSVLENVRPAYRHCVLITHNNFLRIRKTSSTNPVQEELQALIELIEKHRVEIIINGHDHLRNVTKLGNAIYITTDAMYDEFKKASYLNVNIDGNEIKYEFVDL